MIRFLRSSSFRKLGLGASMLGLCLCIAPFDAKPDDIDIFTGLSAGSSGNANVLIVLDNTSNWARQSQHWPGGEQQGQSEVNAIKQVIQTLPDTVNVGILEFVTGGTANDDGGYVRFHILPMNTVNKADLSTRMTTIHDNVTTPDEKRNANTAYGDLMWEVNQYLAGGDSLFPSAVPATLADSRGYVSSFTRYRAALTAENTCAKTAIIFIGNPNSNGPARDSDANTTALAGLGGDTTQQQVPTLTTQNLATPTDVGYSQACTTQAACGISDYTLCATAPNATYDSCQCSTTDSTTTMAACPGGTSRYNVVATQNTTTTNTTTSTDTSVAASTTCYATLAAAQAAVSRTTSPDHAGLTCPATTVTTVGSVTTTKTHSCAYAVDSVNASCSSSDTFTDTQPTTACYSSAPASSVATTPALTACPSGYSCTDTTGAVAATCSAPAASTGTTVCLSSAPSPTTPAASSSVSTSPTLTCPSGYTCTYASSVIAACSASGSSSGVTTTYYATTPISGTFTGTASPVATSPALSCPTGFTCDYTASPSTSATGGGTYGLDSAACYGSTPAITSPSTSSSIALQNQNNTGNTSCVTAGLGTTCSCPSNNDCTYSATLYSSSSVKASGNVTCSGSFRVAGVSVVATPRKTYTITQTIHPGSTASTYRITQTPIAQSTYNITRNGAPTGPSTYKIKQTDTVTTKTDTVGTVTTTLGNTSACYASAAACSTSDYNCSSFNGGCACSAAHAPPDACPSGARWQVQGITYRTVIAPTNPPTFHLFSSPQVPLNADEWTRYFHNVGVNVPGVGRHYVSTYTIDVFNDAQNADESSLYMNMALAGGGKYFQAKNQNAIVNALLQIFAEIQSVNSAFASATLPVNATNRSQDKNQVFIGVFRPDPDAKPRWFGNMKQYQLVNNGSAIVLGDVNRKEAVNSATGFLDECATSYWTSDESPPYWSLVSQNPPASSRCPTATTNAFSDAPDGPIVEKGGVAEVIRKGNDPPTTDTSPTFTVNRVIKTASGGSLVDFTAAISSLSSDLVDYITGHDNNTLLTTATGPERAGNTASNTRPSLHGDVIHSRPQPIDYGGTTGVMVYYGANDGTLRSVNTTTGKENWAFIAPEHFSKLQRIKDNSPQISYPNLPAGISPTPTRKDYFFDGSIGVYQKADNSKIWIYPSMRRGGKMVYAFDVTKPTFSDSPAPSFKWKFGCDGGTCTTDATGMGQSWSLPSVAFIKGFSTSTPAVIFGGGYDDCEDANSASPSCGSEGGRAVFILNGDTGTLLKRFDTDRAVTADIALIDLDGDARADYGYAADTGGNVYRLTFIDGPTTKNPLPAASWTIRKVGHTTGGGRKFLFSPALFQAGSSLVYLAIGTGDREHPLSTQYPFPGGSNPGVTNRFYVFKDDLTRDDDVNLDDASTMVNETNRNKCPTVTSPTPADEAINVLPDSAQKGWYIDLTQQGGIGEQTVTSAVIAGGSVFFSTNRPIAPESGSCANSLGKAYGYVVNLINGSGTISATGLCGGTRASTFASGGLPPSPVVATVPVDGEVVTVVIGGGGVSSPIQAQQPPLKVNQKRRPVYWFKSTDDN